MSRIAARAEVEASYKQWAERLGQEQRAWDGARPERITAAVVPRRVAGGPRRRRGGDPVLHAQRSHGPGDRPLPPRAAGSSACRRTRGRSTPLSLSWGVESLQVEEYTTSDEMVWFAVETALHAGCIEPRRHRARARRRAGSARAARRPTCCGSCASRDDLASTSRRPATPAPRWSSSCTARWTARPACSGCRRRLDDRLRVLRYDRRGYGRSAPHGGPYGMRRPGRRPRRAARRATGGAVRPQLRRQRRARRRRPRTRTSCGRSASTRRRCRGSTGGRTRRPGRRRPTRASPRRTRPSGSCAG